MLTPLAQRLRPKQLHEVLGQEHLLGESGPLGRALRAGQLPSAILWGPPGVGKTTIALLMAEAAGAQMISISAVLGGVKDIREAVERAEHAVALGERVLVFVDEVHRFNKSQQDAFLPHVERGLFGFVGATTENPGFEVNAALLSRAPVFVLRALDADALQRLLDRALAEPDVHHLQLAETGRQALVDAADGDGRRLLGLVELLAASAPAESLDAEAVLRLLPSLRRRFDKGGDHFYDQISALHKSVRGSDPDAALYWLARMLDGGADGRYLARRLIRMASEDIGNADPRALALCIDAAEAYERLGSPEGELALAQAAVYLAVAAKSNAVYVAWKAAQALVQKAGSAPVPEHLRNAPTGLAKSLGHGQAYRYSHDEPEAYSPGQTYFPAGIAPQRLYQPTERGLESKIAAKLEHLRSLAPRTTVHSTNPNNPNHSNNPKASND